MYSMIVGRSTLRVGIINPRIIKLNHLKYSTSSENVKKEDIKKSPEQAKKEAAELAMQSIKDLGGLFSSSSSDDATQPIDTKPIFQNPKLFGTLSLLHQGQVLKELQAKFDLKWTKLTLEDKILGYYIYFGDWGVREDFKNWKTNEPPYDLPFHTPSKVKTTKPTKDTKINKIDPPVILSETPVRIKQFDFKRVDGVSKFFIYLTIFISMFAIYRDKNYGEEFKPAEVVIEDEYETQRQIRQEQLERESLNKKLEDEKKLTRKWYYLWLK
mmetsp:Transcript_8142/g.10216  ORF Transcript_8142/g.10216 Transcript_8142/m.10216 type:complete len:270 (+) Transcript_8142:216-1025(+)